MSSPRLAVPLVHARRPEDIVDLREPVTLTLSRADVHRIKTALRAYIGVLGGPERSVAKAFAETLDKLDEVIRPASKGDDPFLTYGRPPAEPGKRDRSAAGATITVPPGCPLTAAELGVVIGAAKGQTSAETADTFHLSINTIKTHWKRVNRKLGASTQAHAVALAVIRGWVRHEELGKDIET